ncbi:MAG: hypothetical protein IJL20_11295, partial [Lachnospiraceae bacterium]|nr:hypothetical protein [Lachnospiraceae bacterium]
KKRQGRTIKISFPLLFLHINKPPLKAPTECPHGKTPLKGDPTKLWITRILRYGRRGFCYVVIFYRSPRKNMDTAHGLW